MTRGGPDADGDLGPRRPGAPGGLSGPPQRPSSGRTGSRGGSLNVIARHAGVAKGSLFQYFADKRDLYAFITDVASQRVRADMEDRIRELDPSPTVLRLSDPPGSMRGWPTSQTIRMNARCTPRPLWKSTPKPASASRNVIHRHYLEVLRPLVRDAHTRGDLRADSDTDALMSLLLMIFPHLALAPYVRGLDPILGLDEPSPEHRHWRCADSLRYWRRHLPRCRELTKWR